MKTDKVIKITPDGEYNDIPKFKVKLQEAGVYTFFGSFKAKEGDEISYEIKNAKYKTAKLMFIGKKSNSVETKYNTKPDTHQSILRQVAFKGAIELCTHGQIPYASIEQATNEFHKLLNN